MEKVLNQINELAMKKGAEEVVMVEKYKGDDFLYEVICKLGLFPTGEMEYVSWTYNKNDNAFYSGYYTTNKEFALEKFNKRIS